MNKRIIFISISGLSVAVLFILLYAFTCSAQEMSSDIVRLSDTEYRVGTALLDMNNMSLTVPGKVNMTRGQVELLACGPRGKLHESVLVLDIEPEHLQVALLMLGLEPGGGLSFQGDPRTPVGDSLFVYISWNNGDGNHKKVRGEELIYNIKTHETMTPTPWVFSGSRFIGGKFMAALEQSYITTYHDPNTIIDNPLSTGADDTLYEANSTLVPPVGTPVTVEMVKFRK